MRVAVTGGTGFIGSRIVAELVARGHLVDIIDVANSSRPVSVLDPSGLRTAMHAAEAVIHAAGPVREPMLRDPVAGMRLQVAGTKNVLDACVATGIAWVILASSFYVYAGIRSSSVAEDTPIERRTLDRFGIAKIASERLCERYASRHSIDYTVCRFGSAYGAGGSNAVRSFIESAIAGEPITVWGKGNRRNQYTYVTDIARAVGALIDRRDRARASTYNLVSSVVTTTSELAQLVAAVTGGEVRYLLDRAEGASLPYVDAAMSRLVVDWPDTSLADGVCATVRDLQGPAPVG